VFQASLLHQLIKTIYKHGANAFHRAVFDRFKSKISCVGFSERFRQCLLRQLSETIYEHFRTSLEEFLGQFFFKALNSTGMIFATWPFSLNSLLWKGD
jgi:hypothetical protein